MGESGKIIGAGRAGYSYNRIKHELPVIDPEDKLEKGTLVRIKPLPNIIASPSLSQLINMIGVVKTMWDGKYGKQIQVKYPFQELSNDLLFMAGTRIVLPEDWLEIVPQKKSNRAD